jgi:PAS domain S-box-containing protein
MASGPIRILHIEDSEDDSRLVLRNLRVNGLTVALLRVDAAGPLREALLAQDWDIVLCDYSVPGLELVAVMDLVREHAPGIPVVLVTGTVGEEAVADLMRGGIADVVLKDRLKLRLAVIVQREVGLVRLRRVTELRQRRIETVLGFFSEVTRWHEALDASLEYLATTFAAAVAVVSEITGDPPIYAPVASWATSRLAAFGADLKTHPPTPVSPLTSDSVRRGVPLVVARLSEQLSQGSPVIAAKAVAAGLDALVMQPLRANGRRFAITLMFADDGAPLDEISGELAAISVALQPVLYRKISEDQRALLNSGLEEALSGVLITEAAPVDAPGPRIVYANRAMCRMTGYERDDLLGQTPFMFHGPGTDAGALARLHRALAAAEPIRLELQTYRRDGTAFWIDLSITPMREQDRVTHFIAVQTDITERRRLEQERRQRDASFRLLFESNPMPMWVYDIETLAFLQVNNAAITQYGWSRDEFLARTVTDVLPAEHRAAARVRIRELHATQAVTSATHVTATGERIAVRSAVHGIDYEGHAANMAVIWDVTEVEHARRELHRKNEAMAELTERLAARTAELADAADLVRIGTWSMEFNPRRIVWSPETFSILGQDPAIFLVDSNRVLACIHPDDRASSQAAYRSMMRDGVDRPREYRIVRPSGEVRILRELQRLRRDARGRKVGLTGVIQDITEDVQLRRDAQRWADAVEHAGVGITIADPRTATVLYANAAFAAQCGVPRDELVGRHVADFYPPAERERIRRLRAEVEVVGHLVHEADCLRHDGSVYPAMISVTYVRPADGSPPYRIGTTLDISQHKAAEARAQREIRRWADAVEHAGVGISIVDADTATVLYANPAFAAQHGMGGDEIAGKSVADFYVPAERERIGRIRAQLEAVGHVVYEADALRHDGSVYPAMISVTYVRPADGSPAYRIGTTLDISKHREAEARAQREIRRWADAVEHAGVGIRIVDAATTTVLYANTAFAAQHGMRPDEVVGKHLSVFYAPSEHARLELLRSEIETLGHVVYEADRLRQDGSVFPAMMSVTYVRPADGSPPYRIGTSLDISKHKAAEARAKREIQLWSDAVKHAGFGTTIVDTATETVLYANPTFAAQHAMRADQVVGHRVLDAYPPSEHARVERMLSTIQTDGHVMFEADRLRRDGSVFPALISVTYVRPADGSPPYRIGTILDITEQKAARREIQLWFSAVQHAGIGIVIVDAATETIRYANPAFAALHAMQPDQVVGNKILWPYVAADHARVAEILATVETAGHVVFEADRVRSDGSVFPGMIGVTYVRPDDGTPPYRIGTCLDITRLKAAEARALQMQRLATLGEMAAGLAHELNQPLAVVNMAAQNAIAMLEGGGEPAAVVAKLNRMMEQTGRATEIIRNVTMFGRRSSGPAVAARIPDAVDNTLAMLHSRLRAGGIKVRRALPPDLPEAMLALVPLEQVLINLLTNAADAYAAADVAERVIGIEAWREGAEVVLSVADAAGGIPDAVRARIFEPFFTTKAVGQGTGLGLSISYDIVTGAGGSLRVRNQTGGAVFEIRLPARPLQATAPPSAAPPFAGASLSLGRRPPTLTGDPFESTGQS